MFKKDIDRLFQEKFKDFEEQPNANVWKNIDEQLHSKSKFNFFTYKVVGLVTLIAFLSGFLYFNNSKPIPIKDTVVVVNNPSINKLEQTVHKENKGITDNNAIKQSQQNDIEKLNKKDVEVYVVNKKDNNSGKYNNTTVRITKNIKVIPNRKLKKLQKNKKETQVVSRFNQNSTSINTVLNSVKKQLSNKVIAKTFGNDKNQIDNEAKNQIIEVLSMRKLIIQPLKNKLDLVNLSTMKVDIHKAVAYDYVKEDYKKWEVGSVIAPIYYASLTKGSPLDSHISNNDKTNSFSYAYGINAAYKLNKKWSLKSGLFKRNLSYRTSDVGIIFQVISNNDNFETANVNSERGDFALHSMKDSRFSTEDVTFTGDVKQELNYIELPLELKYNLVDRKIKFNLNGGFSTLFLNQNRITFEREFGDFQLGKATNINDVSYSLNLGFDTNIDISKKIKLSIAPSFKYHLNTFSEKDGGFRPYSIGINTGLFYDF